MAPAPSYTRIASLLSFFHLIVLGSTTARHKTSRKLCSSFTWITTIDPSGENNIIPSHIFSSNDTIDHQYRFQDVDHCNNVLIIRDEQPIGGFQSWTSNASFVECSLNGRDFYRIESSNTSCHSNTVGGNRTCGTLSEWLLWTSENKTNDPANWNFNGQHPCAVTGRLFHLQKCTSTSTHVPSVSPTHLRQVPSPSPIKTHFDTTLYEQIIQRQYAHLPQGDVRDLLHTINFCTDLPGTIECNSFEDVVMINVSNSNLSGIMNFGALPNSLVTLDMSNNPGYGGLFDVSASVLPPKVQYVNALNTNITGILDVENIRPNLTLFLPQQIQCKQSFCPTGTAGTRTRPNCTGPIDCRLTCTCILPSSTKSLSLESRRILTVVLVFSLSVAGIFVGLAIAGFIFSYIAHQDTLKIPLILTTALAVYDFFSDISVTITLIYLGHTIVAVVGIGALSLSFLANLTRTYVCLKQWQTDPLLKYHVHGWIKKYTVILLIIFAMTSSCLNTFNMLNSNLFGIVPFSFGLPKKYRNELTQYRILDTVLLENIPQLFIQSWFFTKYGFENEIVLTAFITSCLTVFITATKSVFIIIHTNPTLVDEMYSVEFRSVNREYMQLKLQAKSVCKVFSASLGGHAQVDYLYAMQSTTKIIRFVFVVSKQKDENLHVELMGVFYSGHLEKMFRRRFGENISVISCECVGENGGMFGATRQVSTRSALGMDVLDGLDENPLELPVLEEDVVLPEIKLPNKILFREVVEDASEDSISDRKVVG